MKLTLTPTAARETVQGTPCRLWAGTTDDGVPVVAYVAVVLPQTHKPDALAAFDAALEAMPYERELVSFALRMAT